MTDEADWFCSQPGCGKLHSEHVAERQTMTLRTKTHIATGASYGMTGRRVGTHYFYSESEIADYALELLSRFGRPKPLYLRRVKVAPDGEKGNADG